MVLSDHRPWFSYRGLAPHQFMPMLDVHNANPADPAKRHDFCLRKTLAASLVG